MDIGAIREAMHKQPFLPFSLKLADGREIRVPHVDFIAVPESGRRIAVFSQHDDSLSIIEPLLIVSIDYAATSQGTGSQQGNGT
jgi:hypothetical protein